MGQFADLCQFDVFMNLCQSYYIGDSNVTKEIFVKEVYTYIAKLQQWKDGNTLVVLTPKELFQQFLHEFTNLLDDTSTCTMQNPSQYLFVLNINITVKISPQPSLFLLRLGTTKMDHITGMGLILKNEASRIFTTKLQKYLVSLTRNFQHCTVVLSPQQSRPLLSTKDHRDIVKQTFGMRTSQSPCNKVKMSFFSVW